MADVPRPTALELASGVVVGLAPAAVAPPPAESPLVALERAVLPALQRSPCVVSFSGGMDSSFVLAVATRVARREGLPLPVPVTWRFEGAPRSYETPWQERVVAALGLRDWSVLQAGDDLDLVGPVAQRLLSRYGVLHPPNLHVHLPILELATGGSLITGAGGDQVLSGWRRPGRRTACRVLRDHAPGGLVVRRQRLRGDDDFPWLRPELSRQVTRARLAEARAEPRRLDRRIAWHTRRRDLLQTCAALGSIAADHDVVAANPLVDPGFVTALQAHVRGARDLTRHELMAGLAGGALPAEAVAHRPKARMLEVFLREPTRKLVRSWDGSGVDSTVVDPARLHDVWSHWPIPGNTAGLVQQLWLSATDRRPTTTEAGRP